MSEKIITKVFVTSPQDPSVGLSSFTAVLDLIEWGQPLDEDDIEDFRYDLETLFSNWFGDDVELELEFEE